MRVGGAGRAARADRVGSDAIVTKPFDSHALQGLVRELVGKARAAREEAESAPTAVPAALSDMRVGPGQRSVSQWSGAPG